jgi:hypothetical protein
MAVMLENRSDEGLDALSAKVDDLGAQMERGFKRIAAELREQRRETKAGFDRVYARFDRVDDRFERVNERFDRVNERFERIHRLMIQICGMMLAALIGLIATQL